jgi:hypothetical protein
MFGHGCFVVEPLFGACDLGAGDGVVGVGVVVVLAALLVAALLVTAPLVLLGAAAAPAMPAIAPVVASAPATIVALSILDMVMREPPGID